MLTTGIIISIAAIIISALIYFARVQREKLYRAKEEKKKRINSVVDRYRDQVVKHISAGLIGMQRSGVLGLLSSEEVEEVFSIIENEGLTPGIPKTYMLELKGRDLLLFFQLLQQRKSKTFADGEVRRIIKEVKEKYNA